MIWLSLYLISRILKRRNPEAYEALQQRMLFLTEPFRRGYQSFVARLAGLPGTTTG